MLELKYYVVIVQYLESIMHNVKCQKIRYFLSESSVNYKKLVAFIK